MPQLDNLNVRAEYVMTGNSRFASTIGEYYYLNRAGQRDCQAGTCGSPQYENHSGVNQYIQCRFGSCHVQ